MLGIRKNIEKCAIIDHHASLFEQCKITFNFSRYLIFDISVNIEESEIL